MSKKSKSILSKNLGPNAAPWTWSDFAWVADEWFTSYANAHKGLASVTLFSLAHAVELYLKAGVAKHLGGIEQAVAYQHNLVRIWKDLKLKDSNFMPTYEIHENILDIAYEMDEIEIQKTLSEVDWLQYVIHCELYLIVKYNADLKYFGAALKKKMMNHLSYVPRNQYWITFFKCLRDWLWKGETERVDNASFLVMNADLADPVIQYLKGLEV